MAYATKWADLKPIPTEGLEAWHQVEAGTNTSILAPDFSGKGRHYTVAAGNSPVLSQSPLMGELGYYFNGSRDPLQWTGSVTAKHVFIVMAFEKTAFTGYEGVLSGLTVGNIFTSENTGTKFFAFGPNSSGYSYRKADVALADTNQQAPMNLQFALIEQILPGIGISMNGLQVGKQLVETPARLFQGWYMWDAIYSTLQTGHKKVAILEHIATRFRLWPMVSSGLNVWPFQPEWNGSLPTDKLTLESTAVSGKTKGRSKSTAKKNFELGFTARRTEEYDAACAFWDYHYPGSSFIFRDYGFDPERDTEVTFKSELSTQRNSYHDIDYSFQSRQV
ncbi:MAG: hypothetical protein IT174_10835 [Acidobacteria bacterium]|nr:hypothetical protein [Acidobacteriota bacterium]